jgi:urate oxidase
MYFLVYYLAQRSRTNTIEDFGKELVNYLLEHHGQISGVNIVVEKKAWSNIITSNNVRHPTSFVQSSSEVQITKVKRTRHGAFSIVSGLKDLKVMKTANSNFTNFYRDLLTTLPDATDRLFGTAIQAFWTYEDTSSIIDFEKTRQQIRGIMLDVFADHASESVQHTLHAMGTHLLKNVNSINKVHLTMPNIHCLPVDLTRFGEQNRNEIFMPIDDPHGYIQCALTRQNPTLSKL